jgi:hypothetical protein
MNCYSIVRQTRTHTLEPLVRGVDHTPRTAHADADGNRFLLDTPSNDTPPPPYSLIVNWNPGSPQ